MPSETLPTPDPGFLRDFHFSALHSSCVKQAFGEVEVPWWFKATVEAGRDPLRRQFVFRLHARIEEHERLVPMRSRMRQVHVRSARTRDHVFPVPGSVVEQFREELPRLFTNIHEQWIGLIRPLLYELDPRIGWAADGREELPRSVALDPPVPFSRTGICLGGDVVGLPRAVASPACSFCDRVFVPGDPPAWAGGNLMWVHPVCWEARC